MGIELLEVSTPYGRGFNKAVALAKRAVKNTLVEPEDLILAMFGRMVEYETLMHGAHTFLDFIAPFPDKDKGQMEIKVPMPQKNRFLIMREAEWDLLRSLLDSIEYERAAHAMPHAQYVPLDPKRLMAAGFRFWAATRTVGWQHPVGLKTPKTAAQNKIVRKPRKVHVPVNNLPVRDLFEKK